MKNKYELDYKKLKMTCNPNDFKFETTKDLEPITAGIGQERGIKALEFGINVNAKGYNLYIEGPSGVGKTMYTKNYLKQIATKKKVPQDWCYIYNFENPNEPISVSLPAGQGKEFKENMDGFIKEIKKDIKSTFNNDDFEKEKSLIKKEFEQKREVLMEKLEKETYVSTLKIREKYVSKIDGTVKYLFELPDGNCIESVVMRYHHGLTICISSQVGCRMGCRFCASTIGGLYRSLTPGEILNQVIFAQKDVGERISNIVMMGIGEPLDNFDNVIKFLHNVNHEKGLNIGYRHISLSTCGVVPGIYALAKEKLPITLTISLHAPNNEIRDSIMPVNHKYDIEELLTACREYVKTTNRRISFEYSLIHGVNDSMANAEELANLVRDLHGHINLIPVNKVEERNFEKGSNDDIRAFQEKLTHLGINATVRRELGSDISASCGQLRKKVI